MDLLSQLKPAHRKRKKRLGQGKGSGKGGTSTKGHKGQKARSGVKILKGFEGGQMPLARRLPKFGFSNHSFKTTYRTVNVSQLNSFDNEVRLSDMIQKRWIKKNQYIKVLGQGKLNKNLKIEAHQFSQKAKELIEKAGGQAVIIQKQNKNQKKITQ